MQKILLGIVLFAGIAFVLYQQLGAVKPVGPREALDLQVGQIAKTKKLTKDEEDLFRLQLAVVDYTSKNSQPPDSLTQLVPTYFDDLPKNPKTGEPYRYKRVGNRPLIGDMVDRAEGKVVAKDGSGEKDKKLAVDDENFVNPNEMKLERFVYDSTNRRDPFQPFDLSPKKATNGELSPLEQYALGQLRLTAVLVSTGAETTAIVETAEGQGYTVKAGTKIGTNNGVVVSIEPDRLKIIETVVKFNGEEQQKVEEMILQEGRVDAVKIKKKQDEKRRKRQVDMYVQ